MKRGENMKNNLLIMDKKDNVAIARIKIEQDQFGILDDMKIIALENIAQSHKIALCDINMGEEIIRYGSTIGYATQNIKIGSWIHTHNLDSTNIME